ncbi:MAG: ATP-binding cassette domain-containing protein [Xanthobacteraceae bacterium]|nr:ATP-binding cassette domain-containing protein [Xanthobacteraceae bacterium]
MAPPLVQLGGIALTFGGTPLLDGVDLTVAAGERVCLVGRNGSGKSTLLKIVAGLVEPDKGTRFLQPDATIRYLPQEPDLTGFATVSDYVATGLDPDADGHAGRYLLQQLGLTGAENPGELSGGEERRAALARVLAPDPDILLLDEPTNHLDLPAIEWLERDLAGRRAAIVVISHDRRFLANLSRATVWLDRGRTRRIERGFGDFEAWRDEVLVEEERDFHKLDRKIAAEEHWVRYGVTARRKRNVRRMAGLEALRRERREARRAAGTVTMTAAEAERSGALVIEAKGISKSFDRPVVADLSLRIERGDRIDIVGPNGSGKTTLVNLLTGVLAPDSGTVRLGANLQTATLDQRRESLDPGWTVSEALTGGRGDTVTVGGQSRHVVGYLKDFLFAPEQARTPLSALSGGERGRLMLARALAKPSNLLVLDEPTNDLDLETLDVLQELIGDYSGTVLLISHDRDFLDRVVDAVLVPEGEGKWLEYAGGYSDMLAQRGADLRKEAAKPAPPPRKNAERPAAEPTRRKLNFNEKHALETLPARMATLEAEVKRFNDRLADPALYARDRAAFDKATVALAAAQAELAAAEERWLELELLRSELEGP